MRSCVTSEFNSSEKIHILNRSTLEVATVAHRYLILNFDEAEHTTREVSALQERALQERALQERALQESALQKRSRPRVLQHLSHQVQLILVLSNHGSNSGTSPGSHSSCP